MHGDGHLRKCRMCGGDVAERDDVLAFMELRGPRNITSSNVDRIYDDGGKRFLIIEEKQPGEALKAGQRKLLVNLASLPRVDVWGVRGTPDDLRITHFRPGTGWVQIAAGDKATYERCVHAWFAAETHRWDHALHVLAEVPYEAPAWCPEDLWREFEATLTKVLTLHANRPAA